MLATVVAPYPGTCVRRCLTLKYNLKSRLAMWRVAAFLLMIWRVGGPLKKVRSPRVMLKVRRRAFMAKCELL